jgi:hopanoid biosynthesis associated radical SAM protein HpnH
MRYPAGLVWDSTKYIVGKKLRRERRFPVMMCLEPMARPSCVSNGNNGFHSLEEAPRLTLEQCVAAVEECIAPIVSISGEEPLQYPDIAGLTKAILERGRHLFLWTDGLLIRRRLHMIPPYTNFFWTVKLDGTEAVHEARTSRTGLFAEAIDGIKAAKNAGFFVVVGSTIYPDSDLDDLAALYERLHAMHVDGYLLLAHYPEQKLCRDGSRVFQAKMHERFREAQERLSGYNLMMSPIYFEYLRGERELDCSVWSGPVYRTGGWAAPCGFVHAGYAQSYKALVDQTIWENYGKGLSLECENCQCRAGYETAALLGMNPKPGDIWKMVKWQLGGNLGERREGKQKA